MSDQINSHQHASLYRFHVNWLINWLIDWLMNCGVSHVTTAPDPEDQTLLISFRTSEFGSSCFKLSYILDIMLIVFMYWWFSSQQQHHQSVSMTAGLCITLQVSNWLLSIINKDLLQSHIVMNDVSDCLKVLQHSEAAWINSGHSQTSVGLLQSDCEHNEVFHIT